MDYRTKLAAYHWLSLDWKKLLCRKALTMVDNHASMGSLLGHVTYSLSSWISPDVQNIPDIFGLKMDTGQTYSRSMAVLDGKSCIRKA